MQVSHLSLNVLLLFLQFVFVHLLYRTAELVFNKEKSIKNVSAYRFVLSKKVFASVLKTPENECYCVRPKKARDICERDGVFDLSGCTRGAPLVS